MRRDLIQFGWLLWILCDLQNVFNELMKDENFKIFYVVSTVPADSTASLEIEKWAAMEECPCAWWRHQMETFSALLAICAGNAPVTGEFPRIPHTKASDAELWYFFDRCLNKWSSKQSWCWWFETQSRPLWRHCNAKHYSGTMNLRWNSLFVRN